jgi:hypothetical protein
VGRPALRARICQGSARDRRQKFNPKALAALSRSFVELGYLPKEPDRKTPDTEEFLPKP